MTTKSRQFNVRSSYVHNFLPQMYTVHSELQRGWRLATKDCTFANKDSPVLNNVIIVRDQA